MMTMMLWASTSMAQKHCYTDEVRKELLEAHPELAISEAEFSRQIKEGLKKIDYTHLGKTTNSRDIDSALANPNYWYNIPIVIHVVHDYGVEYLKDDDIFNAFKQWNITFAKQNPDTATVIAPFKKYIGNPHIRLHLATKDPNGNPTKGITRHRSYLTGRGGDQSKFDDWAPSSYLNLWFISSMSSSHSMAAAYAYKPPTATNIPYYDGVIALYDYINNDNTLNHEIGHCFNLDHPWGENNSAGAGACSDGGSDDVDDTPPTLGHNVTGCTAAALYDTICANNYFKIYPNVAGIDSIANYPDTANSENIMDYTYCSKMFTKGQVERMHEALRSNVANRSNLWDSLNLIFTGAMQPLPDLKPIADFACTYSGSRVQYFTCPGTNLRFFNKTWGDTVTKVRWEFSNGATIHSDSTMNNPSFTSFLDNSFTQGGWVNLKMTATGNHSGDSTIEFAHSIFVADPVASTPEDALSEFDAASQAKWPTFNYYNNEFKWEPANVGYYDNHCMKYTGFDNRVNPSFGQYPYTGTPEGDYDDMFSIPVDLTSLASGECNLNFFYSGASRSGNSADLNDTLLISYSTDRGKTWSVLKTLARGAMDNKGALSIPYAPLYMGDWDTKTISIPASARTSYVVFRFRYKPGVDHFGYGISTGNNFYIDRVNFSAYPASVGNVKTADMDVVVVPNPTNGNAYVVVKDANNATAQIIVSDIAGKVIYTTSETINGNEVRIEIPQSAISVKGIYMVQTITGNQTKTQKLAVY